MCRNGCGQTIWFDWERKFDDLGYTPNATKPNIPLEVSDTGEHLPKKHQCPNSTYNRQQQQQPSTGTTAATTVTAAKAISRDDIGEIFVKLERLNGQLEAFSTTIRAANESIIERLDQIVSRLKEQAVEFDAVNDDDGDSLRENPEEEES